MKDKRSKILFFVAEDWFFCSHFMDRALAARDAGYEVLVLVPAGAEIERIRKAGLRPILLKIQRRSLNPLKAFLNIWHVVSIYRRERPDLVHHVALKPILIGTMAARLSGISRVVNAVVGMGFVFTSQSVTARVLRPSLRLAIRMLLNPQGSKVVFENGDDLSAFIARRKVRPEAAILIRGAGVDPAKFQIANSDSNVPIVALISRMLWDKGIGEFVEAARILRAKGIPGRFVLVGDVDPGNHASIDRSILEQWNEEGVVEWWGFRSDIAAVLKQTHIACLPSYREGLPKSLLEAMAASLPCVATDVPGCREAVKDGDNGLLIPARDALALSIALEKLILDSELRRRMGLRGRERVVTDFSTDHVVAQTLALYKEMLIA